MIDPRERYSDPEETFRLAWDGFASDLWTALPGIVQSFDTAKLTAVVQPAIQGRRQKPDGSYEWIDLPQLLDVPMVWPRGGQCTLTFPVAVGDEVLLIFSSRCIDKWWAQGGEKNIQAEPRMHDLSDAFAIPGPFSQKQKIANVSTSTVQLRSNDGSTYVELDPAGQLVHIKAPGGVTIDGDVTVNGTITGKTDVVGGTAKISLKGHKHTGVQSGGSLSGTPQ